MIRRQECRLGVEAMFTTRVACPRYRRTLGASRWEYPRNGGAEQEYWKDRARDEEGPDTVAVVVAIAVVIAVAVAVAVVGMGRRQDLRAGSAGFKLFPEARYVLAYLLTAFLEILNAPYIFLHHRVSQYHTRRNEHLFCRFTPAVVLALMHLSACSLRIPIYCPFVFVFTLVPFFLFFL